MILFFQKSPPPSPPFSKGGIYVLHTNKFVAACPLDSSYARKSWVALNFPHSLRPHIKLRLSMQLDGQYYAVKGMENILVLISAADSINKLLHSIDKLCDEVHADGLDKDAKASLHEAAQSLQRFLNS